MVPLSNYLHDRHNQGVIHFDLAEKLPASAVSTMIRALDDLYFANLWLGLAENAPRGQPFPEFYEPKEKETLYVKRLEVGTPNLIELIGLGFAVIPTFVKVAATLGAGAKVSVGVIKEYAEARKAFAETRKIDAETGLMRVDLQAKAAQLQAQGKITAEAVRHKAAVEKESITVLRQLLPVYARAPQLRLIEPDSAVPMDTLRDEEVSNRLPDVQRRLLALVKRGEERVVSDYLVARRQHLRKSDRASQANLQKARERLMAATGLSEKHLSNILESLGDSDGLEGLPGRQGLKI